MRAEDLIREIENQLPGATSPLSHLSAAVVAAGHLDALADQLVDHFVQRARAHGASWADIGGCLGVSKQAVQKKHSERYAEERAARRQQPPAYLTDFTGSARHCVELAEQEARRLGHRFVGTEHLVLGLVADRGPVGGFLAGRGAGLELARAQAERIVGRGAGAPAEELPLTARAYQTLALAGREADRLGDGEADPLHVLLGVIKEGKGVGAQILQTLAGDLADLRDSALAAMRPTG